MKLKNFLLLFILCSNQNLFGQNSELTKTNLLKVFKASIYQDSKTKIRTNSNPWIVCNKDSAFYKSESILLSNNSASFYHSNCCNFINWTFYKGDAFVLTKEQTCNEPSTTDITKPEDWFKVKVSKIGQDLILETFNQNKLINKFKVIFINPNSRLVKLQYIK